MKTFAKAGTCNEWENSCRNVEVDSQDQAGRIPKELLSPWTTPDVLLENEATAWTKRRLGG